MTDSEQRQKRHAVLYFSASNSVAYKELAARIRSDGGRTTLVWSNRWKGAVSILSECRAIVIEEGCANAQEIHDSYRRYAVDCEIHFADKDGEFAGDEGANAAEAVVETEGATDDEEGNTDPDAASDTVVQAEGGEGDDPVDPASDGRDDELPETSEEAGEEEPSDSERTSSD